MLRKQHSIAKDIPGHIADAHHCERLRLGVQVQFAEVALDRFPRAARRDPHGFMVVAHGAAGSECIAKPEAVLCREPVGDVRKRCGSLVGSDDKVVVVVVVADDVGRRNHRFAVRSRDQVIREVQKTTDERLVAFHALRHPRRPVDGRVRELLGEESALGAGGNDDGIFDGLCFNKAKDFGAEVLAPVGPAQPATGHLAEAQVHALHSGRVHPDFIHRAREGQAVDRGRIEFEA
ncbi:hypothetical protein D9M72_456600 [compost metagenome]